MEEIVVLVPHEVGVAPIAAVDGLRPLRYDPRGELPAGAADAQVLIPPFQASDDVVAIAGRLPRLRLVQLLSAGADRWIDRVPDGVLISDGRGSHGGATAEWAVAALLSIYRDLPRFADDQREHRWAAHPTEELAGKRVLVVGAGDVAANLVRRLEPFEVATTLVARRPRDGVHGIDEVHDLLPGHDACVLIVPLTAQTRGLVDARFLAAMPDGAVLVNAARGPVVDTAALLAELVGGRLRAALDVTDPEPLPAEHPLWNAPGLLLTPHVGGAVPLAQERAYRVAAEQLAAFARDGATPNLVENGY
jgi:phosphoglycerate dehydrogenase-like enzyme